MKKPVPEKRQALLNYNDMIDYIEKKYKIDTRDYAGSHKPETRDRCLREACKQVGADYEIVNEDLTKADEKNPGVEKKLEIRRKIYDIYDKLLPPYQDFWHLYSLSISGNGSEMYIGFEELEDDHEYYPGEEPYPEWAKEILRLIKKEFGKYIKDNELWCWVEW